MSIFEMQGHRDDLKSLVLVIEKRFYESNNTDPSKDNIELTEKQELFH
jgi:hypothetical protein